MTQFPQFSKLPQIPVLRSVHWLARHAFVRAGYRWELRRSGELQLGLWRKGIRKPAPGATPKRLVLIPGFGDTPLSWLIVLGLLKPLAWGRFDEVVIFDFPGFSGFLGRERAFHSIDLLLAAVGDALDSLKPHTILGHSLGGWLTAHYAASCGKGERAGYVGPDTVILSNPAGMHESEEAMREWERKFRRTMTEGFHVLRPHLFANEPRWFRFVEPEFARFVSQEDIRQFVDSFREDHLMDKRLADIRCRVWLLWGDADTLSPTATARTWLKGLVSAKGGSKAVFVRGAGHSPQIERPAVTATVLGQIFAERDPHRIGGRWWSVLA